MFYTGGTQMRKLLVVLVLFGFTGFLSAQNLGLNSITPKVGIISPEDPWDTGFFIGAEADMGEVYENITLHPTVGYWSSGYELGLGTTNVDLTMSNFQIGADGHFKIENVKGLFVGGGLSLNFLSVESGFINPFTGQSTTSSASDTEIGFNVLSGYEFAVSNFAAMAFAKYQIISNLNTLQIGIGITFDMSK